MRVSTLAMDGPALMPKTPVKFVDGLGVRIVPVDGVSGTLDVMFAVLIL